MQLACQLGPAAGKSRQLGALTTAVRQGNTARVQAQGSWRGCRTLGRRLPSTSRKSGASGRPVAAPSIALSAACRMLMASISPASMVLLQQGMGEKRGAIVEEVAA